MFPRTTNRYGCVTLHHYHFYVEQGLPTTPVLLWLSGDQLRAVFDNVVVAEYRCYYDWRNRHVTNIRDGVFYRTRYASSQGVLIPIIPQESLVLYRPQARGRRALRPHPFSNYSYLSGYPRPKSGLTSHICNDNYPYNVTLVC